MRLVPRTLGGLALVVLLAGCSLFDYSGMVPKRFALVYGISGYDSAGVKNLQYPDEDASSVQDMLVSKGYQVVRSRWIEKYGNIFLDGVNTGTIGTPTIDGTGNITDPGSVNAGDAPTKENIISDIQSLSGLLGPHDLVFIYFSGHGMPDSDVPPSTHQWIVPYKGLLFFSSAVKYGGWPDTSIRDDELGSYLAALPTSRIVLVLDTCNSGGFIGNMLEADALPPVLGLMNISPGASPAVFAAAVANYSLFQASPTGISPYNATVISAAGRDESSFEDGAPFNHGIMTYYLLQSAASGDLDKDGSITALECYSYMKAGIDQQWNSDPSVRSEIPPATFAPHISGGPVDFVLF